MSDDMNNGYHSSTEYQPTCVTVLSNGGASFAREVHNSSDLQDNDLINIDGMQVTAKQARELGLLNKVFDEELNGGSARKRDPEAPKEQLNAAPRSETGYADYDQSIDRLNDLIDAGSMTHAEGQIYDTSLGQIAMAGLSVEHVTETLEGLANGSIAETDVPADIKAMTKQVQESVHRAATTAAMTEMGKPAFDALASLSRSHAVVSQVVRQYALDRAQGLHGDISWADLYNHIQDQIGNA